MPFNNDSDQDSDVNKSVSDAESDITSQLSEDNISEQFENDSVESESISDQEEIDFNFDDIFNKSIYKDTKNQMETYVIPLQFVKYFKSWSMNRDLSDTHWKNIFKYQNSYYQKNKEFNFTSILTIAFYQNKLLIIDGQHRIKAINELCKTFNISEDINVGNIRVDLLKTNDYIVLMNKFKEINTCRPIDTTYDEINKLNSIENFIKDKFKVESTKKREVNGKIKSSVSRKYFLKDGNTRKPFLSRIDVSNKFRESPLLMSLDNNTLFKLIEDKNEDCRKTANDNDVTLKQLDIAYEYDCYLGLNDKWIDELEQQVNNNLTKYIF